MFSGLVGLGLVACGGDQTTDSVTGSTGAVTTTTESTSEQTPTSGASTSSTSESSSASSSSASTTSTTSSSSADSTGADPTTDGEPALEIAHGIRLTRVTATQGVQTELVRDGVEVPAEEYAVALISRRKTVLRADWSLHAGFTPRPLIGRLTLWTPEGDIHVDTSEVMVDGPSNDGDLKKTFAWQLPPELVRPGMQYRIEAFEADPTLAAGDISDPPPILPLADRGSILIEDNPMLLRVELVPVKHVFGGMTCMPEVTDVDIAAMRRDIEQHNPVELADIYLGEPMEYTASIGTAPDGFVPVLTELGKRRALLEPPPNVYYYGLLTSCDAYPPGLLGQAYGIPDEPTMNLAFQRIATGRYLDSGAAAAETFVHEIGHTQGRYHIRCSGGEAGTDNDYPYPNGRIGVWGYGIHDTQLRSPTGYRDYMSYCNTSFVSDFGWKLTYTHIKELSSWDAAGPAAGSATPLLLATIGESGQARWWTTHGDVPQRGRGPGIVVEFDTGKQVYTLPASVTEIPDSQAHAIAVALPQQWKNVKQVRLKIAGQPDVVTQRAAVAELHSSP